MVTAVQRRMALERANRAKATAIELRMAIKTAGRRGGAMRAAEAVQAAQSSMTFFKLLQAVPYVGETSARRMLSRAQINPTARVNSEVGRRRRQLLVGQLVAYANGAPDGGTQR
jgi:hypothetical protein